MEIAHTRTRPGSSADQPGKAASLLPVCHPHISIRTLWPSRSRQQGGAARDTQPLRANANKQTTRRTGPIQHARDWIRPAESGSSVCFVQSKGGTRQQAMISEYDHGLRHPISKPVPAPALNLRKSQTLLFGTLHLIIDSSRDSE
jgi:hypothetical protein